MGWLMRRREALTASTFLAGSALVPWATRLAAAPAPLAPAALLPPEKGARLLDFGWRFHLGEIVATASLTHQASYGNTKAGGAPGAASTNFDDSDWRVVDLPHDWAIEAPPVASENLAQGYRARGIGWYRRAFQLDPASRGRYLELQIGGVATQATVWFNGTPLAHNFSGYSSVYVDVTALAQFGTAANSIAIRADASQAEGWWYEGAGIYRQVWLVERAPVHIVTDGVYADPVLGSDSNWRVPVEATLYSIEPAAAEVAVVAELIDVTGQVLAQSRTAGSVPGLARTVLKLELGGFEPRLWSVDEPNLYRIRTRLERGGAIIDERTTPCGFRTLRFDPNQGFFLNGKPLKIKGVCNHQDHAGVGVAVPAALAEWRVRQLKAIGCNAIRTAHNAPDVGLLDACDRLGMLVMNENRNFNVGEEYIEQLQWHVRRDRNRPCVFIWSVFNEEPLQDSPVGLEMTRRLVATVKELDSRRPVTGAMHTGFFAPVNASQALDVAGINYNQMFYDRFHQENPGKPMISTEDTVAFMTRGEWRTDRAKHYFASDDSEHALWGMTQRQAWKEIATRPFMAGAMVWTGFDYHGEPTPYQFPSNSSNWGLLDLCGFPKAAAYIRKALWREDPVVQILPHWNWQAGEQVKVQVAANVEKVELRLNGRLVGSANVPPFDFPMFTVPFAAGRLEASGWRGGKLVVTHMVETAGEPVRLRLRPDRASLAGDGADTVPITIEVVDAAGRVVPTADLKVDLSVSNGLLIGVGNGDPTSLASGKERSVATFNGLAQAIVQSNRASDGGLLVMAIAAGIAPAKATLRLVRSEIPAVPIARAGAAVRGWRQSPVVKERQIPRAIADSDMNTWTPVTVGQTPARTMVQGFVTLATKLEVPPRLRSGAVLRFEEIIGNCTVWVDDAQVAEKSNPEPAGLVIPLQRTGAQADIALVFETRIGRSVGLSGLVFLEAVT